MGESPRRLLLADTTPDGRAILEPLVKNEGWELVCVESTFQVLRTVRDANVDLVLINPDLPGSGVTGADVAKTLKSATQFRHLPVLFLLRGDRAAPVGVPADGTIVLDRWGPARILHALKEALGLAEPGAEEEWAEVAPPAAGPRRAPGVEVAPSPETVIRALAELVEQLTGRLESQLADLLAAQESRFHEEISRRLSVAAQEFFLKEGPAAIREEIADQVRDAVGRAVREVAREVVPEVAERLIAEEIARLRQQYGVE